MLKAVSSLVIDWSSLPKDLREYFRRRFDVNFANDISLDIHHNLPSDILLGTDSEIREYIKLDYDVTDEEIDKVGLINILDEDGSDGTLVKILRLNPNFNEKFDSVQLHISW